MVEKLSVHPETREKWDGMSDEDMRMINAEYIRRTQAAVESIQKDVKTIKRYITFFAILVLLWIVFYAISFFLFF